MTVRRHFRLYREKIGLSRIARRRIHPHDMTGEDGGVEQREKNRAETRNTKVPLFKLPRRRGAFTIMDCSARSATHILRVRVSLFAKERVAPPGFGEIGKGLAITL